MGFVAVIELRDYQRAAVDAIYAAFRAGNERPLIVMPTGSGKAPTLCTFIREALEQWPDQRLLMLVHVRELVEQNLKTMLRIWPDAPVSVYSAGLNSRDMSGQIVFASIQSIYKRAFDLQKVDLVVTDECHLIPAAGDGMYRRLLKDLAHINGGSVPMVGFTATPYRHSTGSLVEGTGRIFDNIAYEADLLSLIESGWLCPPISKAPKTEMSVKGVGVRGGEFIQSQLQAAVDKEEITAAACDEIVAAGKDRRSWLVFSSGVEHARHIRDALRDRGVTAEMVNGETPRSERDRIIRAFKAGLIRCLTNDTILTTGFDHPSLDLLAVMRPTRSAGLWVQMVGRGTRVAQGKENCLILDFGGNTSRHGPLDEIRGFVGRERLGGSAGSFMRICRACRTYVKANLSECPDCGYIFPEPVESGTSDLSATADTAPLLSTQASDYLPVTRVAYQRHVSVAGNITLRADHYCGVSRYSDYVCVETPGYPRQKAESWWRKRSGTPLPGSVDEALELVDELQQPSAIRIKRDGKFFRIVGTRF